MKKIAIAAIVLIVLGLGYQLFFRSTEPGVVIFDKDPNTPDVTIFDSNAAIAEEDRSNQAVSIQVYVTKNISSLSAEAGFSEVLGSTFHVTKVDAKSGKGTISYGDGHNSYTADFTYTTDKKGLVSVKTFVVRK